MRHLSCKLQAKGCTTVCSWIVYIQNQVSAHPALHPNSFFSKYFKDLYIGHYTSFIILEISHVYTLTQHVALKTNISLGQQVLGLESS